MCDRQGLSCERLQSDRISVLADNDPLNRNEMKATVTSYSCNPLLPFFVYLATVYVEFSYCQHAFDRDGRSWRPRPSICNGCHQQTRQGHRCLMAFNQQYYLYTSE